MPKSVIAGPSILSVDVEDWYHILDVSSAPPMERWQTLPARVEMNFRRLLDLFEEHQAHASCFFLGWVAERYPQLVREAVRRAGISAESVEECLMGCVLPAGPARW